MRLLHVDNLPFGVTATTRMLQAGVSAYNKTLLGPLGKANSKHVDLEVVSCDYFGDNYRIEEPQATVVLVALPERELSCRNGGDIMPCQFLLTAQNIIRQNSNLKVYLIPISGVTPMTGVDIIAGLLSGVSGIVEERGLIMPEIISEILSHTPTSRRSNSLLLIGELVTRLQAIKDLVDEWELDETVDPTLDLAIWRAAMALAQLEKLEVLIGVGKSPTSYTTLADALNLAESVTSFRHNTDDLRKLLPHLSRRLLGEDHEPKERLRLPTYARSRGFPQHQPVIMGFDYATTSRKIFHALRKIEIRSFEDLAGMNRRLVMAR